MRLHHSAPTEWLRHHRTDEQTRFPSFCSRRRLYDVQPFSGICFFNSILALTGSQFSIGRAICRRGTLTWKHLFIGKRTMLVMGIVHSASCKLCTLHHCPFQMRRPRWRLFWTPFGAVCASIEACSTSRHLPAGKAGFSLHLHRSTTVLTRRAL